MISIKEVWERYRSTLAIVGLIVSILSGLSTIASHSLGTLFWGSCALIIIFAGLYLFAVVNKRKKTTDTSNRSVSEANHLRGIQPFEIGQSIIGRDYEIKQLITIVENSAFSFGYISGEAGSGKTSLIRAGLITYLTTKGWTVFYFGSVNEAVDLNFRRNDGQDNSLFTEKLRALLDSSIPNTSVLLVIDQFEELFIARQIREDRAHFSVHLSKLIQDRNLKILLCLRKEFVEDLRSFSEAINDPKSDSRSVYVENWKLEDAKKYFKLMYERDGVSFSPELGGFLAEDLSVEGIVRPIELQIVSGYCIESKIETLGEYKQAGKARGILTTFISKILEIDSDGPANLEFQLGGYILRLLCDDFYDSKRTDGGLTRSDLFNHAKESINNHFKGLKDNDYSKAFSRVFERLVSRKLVLKVADNKLNLYHDYLVKGVKELTTGLQTKEELAISMLQKFFETKKIGLRSHLRFIEYKFIRKNLPEGAYTDPNIRATLRNQARYYRRNLVFGLLFFIVAFTILYPPSITYSVKAIKTSLGFDDDYELNSPFNRDAELPTLRSHDTVFRAKISTLKSGENVLDLYPYNVRGNQIASNIYYRLSFLRGDFASIGEDVYMVDTGLSTFSHFNISKGYPFIRDLHSIPHLLKEGGKPLPIVDPNGDGVFYNNILARIFIDTVSLSFIAGTSAGFVYTLNCIHQPIRGYAFQNQSTPCETLCVMGIAGDYYVNTGGSSGDTYVIRRRDNKVYHMTSQVRALFVGGWLTYTPDYKNLYFIDPAKNEISVYPPTIPIDSSDLASPLYTFHATDWGPDDKLMLAQPIRNPRSQLVTTFSHYLSVLRLDSTVYLNILRSLGGAALYLATPDTTLKLPFRLWSHISVKAFANASDYVIVIFGNGPENQKYIYNINKHDLTTRSSLSLDILNGNEVDFDKFDIVYRDSSRFFKIKIFSKDNLVVTSETNICPANYYDNEAGAFWSDDGTYIYFVNSQELYFGKKIGKFSKIVDASVRGLTNSERILQFFVKGKQLYAKSYAGKFMAQRWFTIWGIKLWSLDWPSIKPVKDAIFGQLEMQ